MTMKPTDTLQQNLFFSIKFFRTSEQHYFVNITQLVNDYHAKFSQRAQKDIIHRNSTRYVEISTNGLEIYAASDNIEITLRSRSTGLADYNSSKNPLVQLRTELRLLLRIPRRTQVHRAVAHMCSSVLLK